VAGLVELVADEERACPRGPEAAEDLEDLARLLRRQDRGRFVQHEDPCVAIDGLEDLDTLLLTDGELVDAGRRVDLEAELLREQLDSPRSLAEVQDLAGADDLVAQDDVLRDGEDWHQ